MSEFRRKMSDFGGGEMLGFWRADLRILGKNVRIWGQNVRI